MVVWLEVRYSCLKLVSPVASSRARDGGWQKPAFLLEDLVGVLPMLPA